VINGVMVVSGSQPEIFSPEARITRFWASITIAVSLIAVGSVWFYGNQSLAEKSFLSIVLVALSVLSLAHRYRYQIALDNEGLTERRLFGVTQLKWRDVDDLIALKNITLIKSSKKNKSISIFHPEEGNIFHSFGAVKNQERLREQVVSRSLPYLRELWREEGKKRVYTFPSPSTWLLFFVVSPLLIPALAVIVFGGEISPADRWNYFLLFSPFVAISVYVAYRCGLFSRKTIILDNQGITAKNGEEIIVLWDQISCVGDNRTALGLGSIIVRSYGNQRILIPKSVERFYDLALQLKKRLPNDRFQVSLGIPE
jgi:hypothetical protein